MIQTGKQKTYRIIQGDEIKANSLKASTKQQNKPKEAINSIRNGQRQGLKSKETKIVDTPL